MVFRRLLPLIMVRFLPDSHTRFSTLLLRRGATEHSSTRHRLPSHHLLNVSLQIANKLGNLKKTVRWSAIIHPWINDRPYTCQCPSYPLLDKLSLRGRVASFPFTHSLSIPWKVRKNLSLANKSVNSLLTSYQLISLFYLLPIFMSLPSDRQNDSSLFKRAST
jgi:hypothetical protein